MTRSVLMSNFQIKFVSVGSNTSICNDWRSRLEVGCLRNINLLKAHNPHLE